MKKISVIIPCYNCAKTLDRCLDSIVNQTYNNIEVICVNDGSKDNTLEVLKSYADKYSFIRIIDKPNAGVSAARNDGLKVATGEYVQFIDSDDNFLSLDVFEKNVKAIEKYNADVVVFNFTHPCFQAYLPTGVYDITNHSDFMKYYQDFFSCSMPWNKLFKREVLTEQFDVTMKFEEDEIFNLANMKNIRRVYRNSEVMYNYYCAPVITKDGEASAINSVFADDNVCENKQTLWYKCVDNKLKRDEIFDRDFSDKKEVLEFVRTTDFFVNEFAFTCRMKLEYDIQMKYCNGLIRDEHFMSVLKSHERYGLKLKSEKVLDLQDCMKKFVELGYNAYHHIKDNELDMNWCLTLFGIFAKCFYNINGKLDTVDIVAEVMSNLNNNSGKEAEFTNYLFHLEDLGRLMDVKGVLGGDFKYSPENLKLV